MSVLKMLTGKLTRKRPLWRPRSRWKDNIRIYCTLKKLVSIRGTGLFRLRIVIIREPLVKSTLNLRVRVR